MKYETEQALRVKSLAMDVIEELMKDHPVHDQKDLKQVTELFARCICDLVNVYTNTSEDHEMTLRGTVIKAKIGYNALIKKSTTMEK
jgi:predicted RecB family endonuclease